MFYNHWTAGYQRRLEVLSSWRPGVMWVVMLWTQTGMQCKCNKMKMKKIN